MLVEMTEEEADALGAKYCEGYSVGDYAGEMEISETGLVITPVAAARDCTAAKEWIDNYIAMHRYNPEDEDSNVWV